MRAGNGTLEAAIALGHTVIAAVVSDLTDSKEIAAYALADNRTGELSDWDQQKLSEALGRLPEDLRTVTGWNEDDLRVAMGRAPRLASAAGNTREQYGVIVVCKSEEHQKSVFEALSAAGHDCRVVVT